MNKTKKVMIVGGGDWQAPIIKKARDLGYYVINTNLHADSVGFQFADVGIVADVLNIEENLEIARKHKPDAIITDQSDIAVPTVAYLCEQLGLPGIGVDIANLFTNKYLMREFCRENGFVYPQYNLCSSYEEVVAFTKVIGFPLILKPTNNQSSRGVNKVSSIDELEYKYQDTLSNSRNKTVLVEQFIGGTELTVEGLKLKTHHITLAISKKAHLKENEAIAYQLLYTPSDPNIDYNELKLINNRLIEAMKLPFGITHAEYKYYNNQFYLIEVAARGGGTKISSHIAPFISGVDTNKAFISMALGEEPGDIVIEDRQRYVLLQFFLLSSGKVKNIHGLEEIRLFPNVIDTALNFEVGSTLYPPSDDRSRAGYYIAHENSEEQLLLLSKKIESKLVIEYE